MRLSDHQVQIHGSPGARQLSPKVPQSQQAATTRGGCGVWGAMGHAMAVEETGRLHLTLRPVERFDAGCQICWQTHKLVEYNAIV